MSDAVRLLAIETSTVLLGVAVAAGDDVLYEEAVVKPRVHSSMLLPMCESALRKTGFSPQEVDAIAVSVGPGSFTGLRIGCATAQGLGHAWGKPIVPVSTFEALMEQACDYGTGAGVPLTVAVVQGKAKAQTVTALYSCHRPGDSGKYSVVIPPTAASTVEFAHNLASVVRGRVLVTGDAAVLLADFCEAEGRDELSEIELTLVGEQARLPRPSTVARIGVRMFREGLSVESKAAVPRYFRRSQAESVMLRKSSTQ